MPLLLILALLLTSADHAGADAFAVGVVGSDDTALSDPVARDTELTTEQIEAMVRRAVDLVGGMAAVVPDSARLVALKPNITMASGRGYISAGMPTAACAQKSLTTKEFRRMACIEFGESAGNYRKNPPIAMAEKHAV